MKNLLIFVVLIFIFALTGTICFGNISPSTPIMRYTLASPKDSDCVNSDYEKGETLLKCWGNWQPDINYPEIQWRVRGPVGVASKMFNRDRSVKIFYSWGIAIKNTASNRAIKIHIDVILSDGSTIALHDFIVTPDNVTSKELSYTVSSAKTLTVKMSGLQTQLSQGSDWIDSSRLENKNTENPDQISEEKKLVENFNTNSSKQTITLKYCDSLFGIYLHNRYSSDLENIRKAVSAGQELIDRCPIDEGRDQESLKPLKTEISELKLKIETAESVAETALKCPCAKYKWKDRGVAPIGYIKGIALSYAKSYFELKKTQNDAVKIMSQKIGAKENDALAWYGIVADSDVERLRAVYVLAMGLGMRESSGNTTEGRDTSVAEQNANATNAEAGLFQVSFDSFNVSPELARLLSRYKSNTGQCLLNVFSEGVKDRNKPLVGSGKGAEFQQFTKECPSFAAEYVMIMLRLNRTHFGPIKTKKAEYNLDAEEMFKSIEKAIDKML